MKNPPIARGRLDLVDALRGFALLGIILLHNVEHFDLANYVVSKQSFLLIPDRILNDLTYFLFAGKSYALFSLLFGFSFYKQFEKYNKMGIAYDGRFAWRMVLLICIGLFHVSFYSGEILSCYAVVGFFLIPLRKRSNRTLFILAIILLLEPWELGQLIYGLINPDYVPVKYNFSYFYGKCYEVATQGETLFDVMKVNIYHGIISAHFYNWVSGRYFQTLALFIFGLLLGRKSLFVESEESQSFWRKILLIACVAYVPLYILRMNLPAFELRAGLNDPLRVLLNMWSSVAFMFILASSLILLWFNTSFKKVLSQLVPYGRMSLTNYIASSIMGSILYYHYGFGFYAICGATLSLLTGIIIFRVELAFSRWWLKSHKQGPLEWLWAKATWLFSTQKR